jgi:hypothetical protein
MEFAVHSTVEKFLLQIDSIGFLVQLATYLCLATMENPWETEHCATAWALELLEHVGVGTTYVL